MSHRPSDPLGETLQILLQIHRRAVESRNNEEAPAVETEASNNQTDAQEELVA